MKCIPPQPVNDASVMWVEVCIYRPTVPITIQVNLCMMTVNAPEYNTTQLVAIDAHLAESNKVNKVWIWGKGRGPGRSKWPSTETVSWWTQKATLNIPISIGHFDCFSSECSLLLIVFRESPFEISGILWCQCLTKKKTPKKNWYLRLETFCGQFFYFKGNDTATSLDGNRFMEVLLDSPPLSWSQRLQSTAVDQKYMRWKEDSKTHFRSTMSNWMSQLPILWSLRDSWYN